MNCDRFEKWISDALDGDLPEKKKRKLAIHLNSCSHCRGYKNRIAVLHNETGNLGEEKLAPEYWEGFSGRLHAQLVEADKETGTLGPKLRAVKGGMELALDGGEWICGSGFDSSLINTPNPYFPAARW